MSRVRVTHLGDIVHDNDLELVSVGLEELAQVARLALRAHGAPDGVARLEEGLEDPDGDVAVRAGDEDLS